MKKFSVWLEERTVSEGGFLHHLKNRVKADLNYAGMTDKSERLGAYQFWRDYRSKPMPHPTAQELDNMYGFFLDRSGKFRKDLWEEIIRKQVEMWGNQPEGQKWQATLAQLGKPQSHIGFKPEDYGLKN